MVAFWPSAPRPKGWTYRRHSEIVGSRRPFWPSSARTKGAKVLFCLKSGVLNSEIEGLLGQLGRCKAFGKDWDEKNSEL